VPSPGKAAGKLVIAGNHGFEQLPFLRAEIEISADHTDGNAEGPSQ
jgi:hypothetical protein